MKACITKSKLLNLVLGGVLGVAMAPSASWATHPHVSLPDSDFQIDADANLVLDSHPAAGPDLDWISVNGNGVPATADPAYASQMDAPTGSGDDSFVGGTKEDTVGPGQTTGSIPNNKSDLLNFGLWEEENVLGNFLHLFWSRVQNPSGTTLMEFEFNAGNAGVTNGFPNRVVDDLLLEYKLASGGTNPELFLYKWLVSSGTCEAKNNYPCWGDKVDLVGTGLATGSINTNSADASSMGLGSLDPFTFGEASVDLEAFFPPGECKTFGAVYLKSRSSDSFKSQLKDFITPLEINITNCATITIIKKDDQDPAAPLPGAVFQLFNDDGATDNVFDDPNATPAPADPDTPVQIEGVDITCTTNIAGVCTMIDIVPGEYWIDEVVVPDGYQKSPDAPKLVTITADADEEFEFEDPRLPGSITIIKEDDDGNPLVGAVFELYEDENTNGTFDAADDGPVLDTCTTALDTGVATCTFSNIFMPPEHYCVYEAGFSPASLGDLYNFADPRSQCVTLSQTVAANRDVTLPTFENPRKLGAIRITKTRDHRGDGGNGIIHAGVDFTISGGGLAAADNITVTTGADGTACVDGLLISTFGGNYTVTEEDLSPAYYPDVNPQTVTVTEGTCAGTPDTVSFHNTTRGDITVSFNSQVAGALAAKISCVNGTPLPNPNDASPNAWDDVSETYEDLTIGTYTCTVHIVVEDPAP